MKKKETPSRDIQVMLQKLESSDGLARNKARLALVAAGKPAVPVLSRLILTSAEYQTRWEAAKILSAIADERAIPALVKVFEGEDEDLAWLAAEALKRLKRAAWPALLRILIKRGSGSVVLRNRAHHVFSKQKDRALGGFLEVLVKALAASTRPESTAAAAYQLLREYRKDA